MIANLIYQMRLAWVLHPHVKASELVLAIIDLFWVPVAVSYDCCFRKCDRRVCVECLARNVTYSSWSAGLLRFCELRDFHLDAWNVSACTGT